MSAPPRDDRPLLVTSALPYANGPLHFGHIAGAYLPADLFARYHRLRGRDVLFVCGTDEHGVSITVHAEREGQPYREYVTHWHGVIRDMFGRLDISFDHFARTSTDTPEHPHYDLSREFFLRLLRAGAIVPRTTRQHFCLSCARFLPDRYVVGTCYLCGQAARGDECKGCGAWLEAVRLIDPRCVTCGSTPEVRDTLQYELDLSPFAHDAQLAARLPHAHPTFRNWRVHCLLGLSKQPVGPKTNVRTAVEDKLLVEGEGLRGRPITRDLPWGVPLPQQDLDGRPLPNHEGKVLYVWFDAPVGYVSATIEWAHRWAQRTGAGADAARAAWRRFWITSAANDYAQSTHRGERGWPGPRLVHFIGKDNIPFHCVVFPAMLGWQAPPHEDDDERFRRGPAVGERWVLPENVPANEFYHLEGRKFSTSDHWMLDAPRMLELFGADPLRWYLTVSMPETADSQFLFGELRARINADLADTLGNYASRVLKFVKTHLGGVVPEPDEAFEHDLQRFDERGQAFVPVRARTGCETRQVCERFLRAGTRETPSLAWRIENYEFRRAADELVLLGRLGNAWFDRQAPWKTRKLDDPADCRTALWAHCQILSALAVGMWPFLPRSSDALRRMLGLPALTDLDAARADRRHALSAADDLWCFLELKPGHVLGEPGILFQKIDEATVDAERARLLAGT